jgi:hypothetical protein
VPDPDRLRPVSDYDRYVGMEDAYSFARELAGERQLRPVRTPFETVLSRSRVLFEAASGLAADARRHRQALWWDGRGGDELDRLLAWAELRDSLVERMRRRAETGADRERLIAALVALKLASGDDELRIRVDGREVPLAAWAAETFSDDRGLLWP